MYQKTRTWLSDQRVKGGDCKSFVPQPDVAPLSTGTPQGCVLSPLLHSLYTADQQVSELSGWCQANNLILNPTETKDIILDFRRCRGDNPLLSASTQSAWRWSPTWRSSAPPSQLTSHDLHTLLMVRSRPKPADWGKAFTKMQSIIGHKQKQATPTQWHKCCQPSSYVRVNGRQSVHYQK